MAGVFGFDAAIDFAGAGAADATGAVVPIAPTDTPATRRLALLPAPGVDLPARSASGDFKPFGEAADPVDFTDYVADAADPDAPFLQPGEQIASFALTLTPEAALWGVVLGEGEYAPALNDERTAVRFWAGVAPNKQGDKSFAGDGVRVGVEITGTTSNAPPRRFQRTAVINVRQR